MGVKLAAALGGSVELVPTNTASNYTVTLPASTGTVVTTTSPKTGNVLQVVQSTYSTFTSTSSATIADFGLTASITPSSTSSKILVLVTIGGIYSSGANGYARFLIDRSGTSLISFGTASGYNSAGSGGCDSATSYLDSPSSSSSLTYKIRWSREGTGTVNANNTVAIAPTACTSTITLLEIAG